MDDRDAHGKRIYMDDDGNTIVNKSIECILKLRRQVIENATNSAAIDRYVAERPITPAEAMLEFNGNIFQNENYRNSLQKYVRIKTLISNKSVCQIGSLMVIYSGQIKKLVI